MNWFLFALAGPALWSISNHLDKLLISKYFKGVSVGAQVLFACLFGAFILPIIYLIEPNVFKIQLSYIPILWTYSLTYVLAGIIYYYALKEAETSTVVPMFQLIPVFGYFVAYLVLGEVLAPKQIISSLLIIFGAVMLSLDLTERGINFKKSVLFLMIISSFLYSLGGVLFKFAALRASFWVSTFWSVLGATIMGLLIFIFIKSYRRQFLNVFRHNKIPIIGLNGLNETIVVIAELSFSYAFLLAPITLVWVVNGFQPFFVFLYGVILTLFFPHLGSESLLRKHLVQKILAIAIIFTGTYLLNS